MTVRELRQLLFSIEDQDQDREVKISIRSVYKGKPCNVTATITAAENGRIAGIDDQFDELMELGDYDG